jgi:hypothetical protein
MEFFNLTPQQWLFAAIAAFFVGLSKSGFGGVGMLTVAFITAAMRGQERASSGVILPLLLCGDLLAVRVYRKHVQWPCIRRMLPPALLGISIGWWWMGRLTNAGFRPLIGWIVLTLIALHLWRKANQEKLQSLPHHPLFAWGLGITAGITTMLANSAGPIMTVYFLAVELAKLEYIATAAWFFLIINLIKVPLSANLGLIHTKSLLFNATLLPIIPLGIATGRALVHRIDQKRFETVILTLTALTTLNLIFF